MNSIKMYIIVLCVAIGLMGLFVCKHTPEKINEPESEKVGEPISKKDLSNKEERKKNLRARLDERELAEENVMFMMETHERHAFMFNRAGEPVEVPKDKAGIKAAKEKKDKIFIKPLCIEGFKWLLLATIYNNRVNVDIEQMDGPYGKPVPCH